MCGIFGYIGTNTNAPKIVFEGLKELEYRGYDSWGVASLIQNSKNKSANALSIIDIEKHTGKISTAHFNNFPQSTLSIGHTRWATHGGVTTKNTHPHTSTDKSIAIVHNGIIENYDTLINKLKKMGYVFVSDTDSELTAHYIHHFRKKYDLARSVRKTFLKLKGLNALVAIDNTSDQIIAVKYGSPIVIGSKKNEQFLSSDPSVVSNKTSNVYYLKDGELVVLSRKGIELFVAVNGLKKQFKYKTIKVASKKIGKAGYLHYLIKEIYEQPSMISRIANNDTDQAMMLSKQIMSSFGTYLIGCGTAAYACMSGAYIFSEIAKRHVNTCVASEFGYQLDFLTKKSLVIALSQSGETADLIEAMKKAKAKHARLAGLVNMEESTIYRMTDVAMGLHAGIEKSVASTKAFIAMLSHIILTAYALDGDIKTGSLVLNQASISVTNLLNKRSLSTIQKLAKHIARADNMFFVGRGLSYPASLEAALKIKELSYIHAEGFAAGELKHGVLALVSKKTPCIVFAPSDRTYQENITGAMEMKARGGFIIGISEKPHDAFDYHIPIKQAGIATIIPNVVFSQILSYYITLVRGLDPDMPRNLAKSVTVK